MSSIFGHQTRLSSMTSSRPRSPHKDDARVQVSGTQSRLLVLTRQESDTAVRDPSLHDQIQALTLLRQEHLPGQANPVECHIAQQVHPE